jgi:hypothetical protein
MRTIQERRENGLRLYQRCNNVAKRILVFFQDKKLIKKRMFSYCKCNYVAKTKCNYVAKTSMAKCNNVARRQLNLS